MTTVYRKTDLGEGMARRLMKAKRLIHEGAIVEVRPGVYTVEGDTATHHLDANGRDVACSCKASAFGDMLCSHKMAVLIHEARGRVA